MISFIVVFFYLLLGAVLAIIAIEHERSRYSINVSMPRLMMIVAVVSVWYPVMLIFDDDFKRSLRGLP